MNCSRPDWKPIIALARVPDSSCSERNSMQRAVSRVAWIRSNGDGSPPSWMCPRIASRASKSSPPSFSNSDLMNPVV